MCQAAGGPETYDADPVKEAHIHIPFTPEHIQRAIELLYESLDEFEVSETDTESVVEAVASFEEELLARPDDNAS